MLGIRTFGLVTVFVGGLAAMAAAGEPVGGGTLTIAAAPSLKAALGEVLPMFEKEHGATVRVVYGPSKALGRDIEAGSPVDVFLPAAAEEVERLHKKGLTLGGGPRVYAQTSLVLVMSAASQATSVSFREALPDGATRIALGDPRTSALGDVTARALVKRHPAYKNRYNLLYGQHSEDLVNLIHMGKADVAIVYRVDAINNGRVRIIDEAPAGASAPVRFGAAVVWTCREESQRTAERFVEFIASPRIQKLLHKYGFDPVLWTTQ